MGETTTTEAREISPGVFLCQGVHVNPSVAMSCFTPLVGKTISRVVLQQDQGSSAPLIVLEFAQGGAALVLIDAEGNGPGFIEYVAE